MPIGNLTRIRIRDTSSKPNFTPDAFKPRALSSPECLPSLSGSYYHNYNGIELQPGSSAWTKRSNGYNRRSQHADDNEEAPISLVVPVNPKNTVDLSSDDNTGM